MLPSEEKNKKLIEMVQEQIKYDEKEKRFEVNYLYNQYLPQLPTYEQPVLRIQKRLEENLMKAGESKIQKYNEQIQDFSSDMCWNGFHLKN